MEILLYTLPLVLSGAIYAAWDVACKVVAQKQFNLPALNRIAALEAETDKLRDQQQKIIERVTTVGAGVVSRMPGRTGPR